MGRTKDLRDNIPFSPGSFGSMEEFAGSIGWNSQPTPKSNRSRVTNLYALLNYLSAIWGDTPLIKAAKEELSEIISNQSCLQDTKPNQDETI